MSVTADPGITNAELTEEEIDKASRYLSETRDALVDSVSGLSAAQWDWKPGAECWSIGDIVEHVALIEDRVHMVIGKMGEAPGVPEDFRRQEMDEAVLREVPNRATKVMAPAPVMPTQRWSGPEALQRFVRSREETRALLGAPCLRGRVVPHPLMGLWEGYHWILAAGAHSARHTEQIREVKSSPSFVALAG